MEMLGGDKTSGRGDHRDLQTLAHGKFGDTEFTVLLYELKADMNAYLGWRGRMRRSTR